MVGWLLLGIANPFSPLNARAAIKRREIVSKHKTAIHCLFIITVGKGFNSLVECSLYSQTLYLPAMRRGASEIMG